MEIDKEQTDKIPPQDEPQNVNNTFRNFYMNAFTNVFGDELNQLRQEENFNGRKVTLLIDCIEQGIDIFSDLEKSFVVNSLQRSNQK